MKRVSIIGSGNVGTNTAFFIAENRTASVTLVDVKEGIATGKALDLMEAGPLRDYDTSIDGTEKIDSIRGSDVVIIAAGRVRKPGEKRVDLYRDNAPRLVSICEDVRKLAPDAVVVNIVEPVDLLTQLAQETLEFERNRVLGIGGLLSATRVRFLVSNALGVSPREVTALVVGPHRRSMIFVRNSIRVSGIPVLELMESSRLEALLEEARVAGDAILDMAQRSTSYYGPSAAAAGLVDAIVRDTHRLLPVSVRCEGEYGVHDLCVGVAAFVGASGALKIVEAPMTDREREAFRHAVLELRQARAQVTGEKPAS